MDIKDSILRQFEFYFGDSNLNKDRFLRKKIEESDDGYIDVKLFTTFNKIKNITTDINLILEALQSSQLIEVNKEKQAIRRIKQLPEDKETVLTTVYVENFDESSTHETLSNLFGQVGNVQYPEGKLKGFAFIEYDNKESAERAVRELNRYHHEQHPNALRVISKELWLDYREKYKEILYSQTHGGKRVQKHPKKIPNSVVCISPLVDNTTKDVVQRSIGKPVARVEIIDGKAFVQCHSAAAATEILHSNLSPLGEVKTSLLQGAEEEEYWQRVLKPRKNPKGKKTNTESTNEVTSMEESPKQKQGPVHVFFDSDDE